MHPRSEAFHDVQRGVRENDMAGLPCLTQRNGVDSVFRMQVVPAGMKLSTCSRNLSFARPEASPLKLGIGNRRVARKSNSLSSDEISEEHQTNNLQVDVLKKTIVIPPVTSNSCRPRDNRYFRRNSRSNAEQWMTERRIELLISALMSASRTGQYKFKQNMRAI